MDTSTMNKLLADNLPLIIAFVGYLLLNVMKRGTKPSNPLLAFFWQLAEYMCFLTWDKWGGSFKLLFTTSKVEAPSDEPAKPVE